MVPVWDTSLFVNNRNSSFKVNEYRVLRGYTLPRSAYCEMRKIPPKMLA